MFLPDKKDAVHKAWLYRLLQEIADDSFLASLFYFKGGTCAAMRGFLDRFSVDLDFDFVGSQGQIAFARRHLENVFKNLGLEIKDKSAKAPQYFLRYEDKNSSRSNLKIDTFFPPLPGNQYEPVRLIEIDRILYCQTRETMFSNKLISLIDRFKKGGSIASRDLYDIHHFFIQDYSYDKNIIEKYSGTKRAVFFKDLREFIDTEIKQENIDQDLNFLLPRDKFRKIRKFLKSETLMFLKDEIERLGKGG